MKLPYFALVLLLVIAGLASGQSSPPTPLTYSYRLAGTDVDVTIEGNGNILFGEVGLHKSANIRLTMANHGQSTWQLASANVTGVGFSVLPQFGPIPAQKEGVIDVTFQPESSGFASAVLTIALDNPLGERQYTTFQLSGSAPLETLLISWSPDSAEFLPAAVRSKLIYPPTRVSSTARAIVRLAAAPGASISLTSVRVQGAGFELAKAPELPVPVPSDGYVELELTFMPSSSASYAGALTLSFGSATAIFTLDGPGVAADLEVSTVSAQGTSVVKPGGTILFPAAQARTASTLVEIIVQNKGAIAGRVTSINATGASFRASRLPPLPRTLEPGEELRVAVEFAPETSGEAAGTLRIDGLIFNLSGAAFEPRLSAALLLGDRRLPITPSSVAVLPNTAVGATLDFAIELTNAGDQPATVSSVNISGTSLSLTTTPALPSTLQPGQLMQIGGAFAPVSVSAVTGVLQVDGLSFNLRTSGIAPPSLPSVTFPGVSDPAEPGRLLPFGIELGSPYSSEIAGTLTLDFSPSAFADDPSILFTNGRRTVDFRIPAGSKRALFAGNSSMIALQTGTNAGTITLNATMSVGSVAVKSNTPQSVSMTIPPSPPKVQSAKIVSVSATSLEVQVSGFCTARSISRLLFDFVGSPGANLRTEQVQMDVAGEFNTWYQGATSKSYGSQFTITARLQVTGDVNAIEAVNVSASNTYGTSPTVRAGMR